MPTCYTFDTCEGPFHILFVDDDWLLIHDGESLGRYIDPAAAASDLSIGRVPLLTDGTDAAGLRIPADLALWQSALVR
jgi:hypothetical protein